METNTSSNISNINKNIFITQDTGNLDRKLSKTLVLETVPKNSLDKALENWESTTTKYNTEWRWRFLEFDNNLKIEISYKIKNSPRVYCTKSGDWEIRDISEIYDKYVVSSHYYYN